jgi:transcriptional regulator with XRE-family HTH domain
MTTLGERIRELREKKDFSLREFAGKLDLSPAFVSDVELGRRYPSDEVLARMAKLLGATLGELRSLDTRPTGDEVKRLASNDPAWGFAFRSVLDRGVTPEELLKFAEKKQKPKGVE